jgi:serine/threonine protein kinase
MDSREFFERFEIDYTQPMDKNGLGSVYLSTDILNGTNCVVKITEIHKSFDNDLPILQFKKAQTLSDPRLINYLGICKIESEETVQYFLAMQYFPLGNMAERVTELSVPEKSEILKKIIDGLFYLHEQNIVWQQLRAEHILLDKSDGIYNPVFINFANEKLLPKSVFHNYEYLSPEQLIDTENVDSKSDIWALGILTFWFFCAYYPFGKKTTQHPNKKIAERIVQEHPEIPDSVPQPYKKLIEKCLSKDKKERWESAQEIQNYLNDKSIEFKKTDKKEAGILDILEKMGEDSEEVTEEPKKIPILQRRIKRKPTKPVSWWEPFVWILTAIIASYFLTYLLK